MFHLALQRLRRAGDDPERLRELGMGRIEGADARLVASLPHRQHFQPPVQLVANPADRAARADGAVVQRLDGLADVLDAPGREHVELVVLGIHVRRDLLEVHDQRGVERRQSFELDPQRLDQRDLAVADRASGGDVAVDVIDERGIEGFLPRKQWRHQPP